MRQHFFNLARLTSLVSFFACSQVHVGANDADISDSIVDADSGATMHDGAASDALDETRNDGGDVLTAEAFLRAYADRACDLAARCSLTQFIAPGAALASASCRELTYALHTAPLRAVRAGVSRLDAAQAARCLAAFDDCARGSAEINAPVACATVFVGSRTTGVACENSIECAPTLFCDRRDDCPGTCRARVGTGANCTNNACDAESICLALPPTPRCQRLGNLGEPCDAADRPCRGGIYCREGVCRGLTLLAGIGAPCDASIGLLCEVDLSCSSDSQRCVARVQQRGEPCEAGSPGNCAQGLTCDPGSATCRLVARVSEPCVDNLCEGFCDGGTCTELVPIGGVCRSQTMCASRECQRGVCVERSGCQT